MSENKKYFVQFVPFGDDPYLSEPLPSMDEMLDFVKECKEEDFRLISWICVEGDDLRVGTFNSEDFQ